MPFLSPEDSVPTDADIGVVGTGFASSFFLWRLLREAPPDLRVVVFERGEYHEHPEHIARFLERWDRFRDDYVSTGTAKKPWRFTNAFGGSSNCWAGNTPRMLPSDFETATRYGAGVDWPISYDDLERYYVEAEQVMAVAGNGGPHYMSQPHPLPPHRLSLPEQLLEQAWPGAYFRMPTVRASIATDQRPRCCANGVCTMCPVDAKFTILNGLAGIYDDPRVTVVLGTRVHSVDVAAGRAQGLNWRRANAEGTTKTDHAVLGANGLFNPEILLRSGDPSPLTGRRLHEQVGIVGQVLLDGVDSFQGTTNISGIGYMLYDNDDRRQSKAAALLETKSVGRMRADPGRWRQVLPIRLVIEDMPDEVNLVRITPDSDKPVAEHNKISDYAQRAVDSAEVDLAEVFQKLPVERIEIKGFAPTESHIQGTTVMGHDPTSSVTDADGLHHRWGDLRILGSSLFPTGAAANPTLTIAAHAIRAAERMEL